jgi:hypothetical protein
MCGPEKAAPELEPEASPEVPAAEAHYSDPYGPGSILVMGVVFDPAP